jgi:DNA invertase Pin-like site-specific DNA recombinase
MRVGIYARISKDSSDVDNQLLLLKEYCHRMNYEIYGEYSDVASGIAKNRPEFDRMMKDASQKKFDMLLFYALDRLTRAGTRQTIHYLEILESYGVAFKSFTEQYIDSSGIFKDVVISLLASIAQQERIRLSERIKAALAKSKARKIHGRTGGRPTLDAKKIKEIKKLKTEGMSIMGISKELKISRGTVYQYL